MKKFVSIIVLLSVLVITACSNNPATRKPAGFPAEHPMHGIQ